LAGRGAREEREGEAYQGRWREGARDAMAGRSQLPEELPPLGRSRAVQPARLSYRAELAHLLFYYPEVNR
jgi:hypothetical protein